MKKIAPIIACGILAFSIGTPVFAQEQNISRLNFLSTLRERQLENRRELQERVFPTSQETERATVRSAGATIELFMLAHVRLGNAAEALVVRRNALFEQGVATTELDALLQQGINLLLETGRSLRTLDAHRRTPQGVTETNLRAELIAIRANILTTQATLTQAWALVQNLETSAR